jgi:hypothetical protein
MSALGTSDKESVRSILKADLPASNTSGQEQECRYFSVTGFHHRLFRNSLETNESH